MTESPPIEFFFDVVCPFAYLASTQIERLAADAGITVVWRPVLLGGVLKAVGTAPNFVGTLSAEKTSHIRNDARRFAEWYGVDFEWHPGHPVRTLTAMRALTVLLSGDLAEAGLPPSALPAVHALFRAYWVEHRNLADPTVVSAVLEEAGFPGAELVASAESQPNKAALQRASDAAAARGVFGVPSFIREDRLVFGQDRWPALGFRAPAPRCSWAASSPQHVDFWYDFSSPFAYLGACQIEEVARRATGTEGAVRWRPMLLGGLFKHLGQANTPIDTFSAAKRRHVMTELHRSAAELGVPFAWPSRFPMKTVTPLRIALLLSRPDRARFSHRVFRAYWGEDQDIADDAVLASLLAELDLAPALLEDVRADGPKAALITETSSALAAGVFGTPTFIVGDQLFWGQDRLPFVEHALQVADEL